MVLQKWISPAQIVFCLVVCFFLESVYIFVFFKEQTAVTMNGVIRYSDGVIFVAAACLLLSSLFFNFCSLGKGTGKVLLHGCSVLVMESPVGQ